MPTNLTRGHDDFLNPTLRGGFDIYLPRRAVLDALIEQLPNFHRTMLDVGCAQKPYRSILLEPPSRVTKYIGLDLPDGPYARCAPFDLDWDGHHIPLEDSSVDCAMSTEVFEQCPDPESIMCEVERVLRPGGRFFFTVPFLWPVHNPPIDQYRFTPYALERQLRNAGFEDVKLQMFGGYDASL